MTCSISVGLAIRCNITPRHSSKVSSEDKLSVVILMKGGHDRAHGGRARVDASPMRPPRWRRPCCWHVTLIISPRCDMYTHYIGHGNDIDDDRSDKAGDAISSDTDTISRWRLSVTNISRGNSMLPYIT